MKPRALWLPLCLAVLGAAAPLRESVAAAKVDLHDYLAYIPMQGDAKTWTSEAGDFTNTAIGVTPGAKRTVIITEQTDEDSTVTDLEVVVHGKCLLAGSTVLNDGVDEIMFLVLKPKKSVAFKLKQGKPYKFSIPSKVYFNGMKVGKAKEYGTVTFLGFEDANTPLGTFVDAAHFMRTDNLRIKSGRDVVEIKDVVESWVVPGLGGIRFIQSENVYENKVLTDSTPATEYLFDHGIIEGEPFPPEAPATISGSATSGLRMTISLTPGDQIMTRQFFVVEAPAPPAAGIDLMNADASASVTVQSVAPGALVGTRVDPNGEVIYLPGVDYSQPLPNR